MANNEESLTELYVDLLKVGYTGDVKDFTDFKKCFGLSSPNIKYYDVIIWISGQLTSLLKLENRITADSITIPSTERLTFVVELSSLLKELRCPISEIMSTNICQWLTTEQHQVVILEYLLQELRAAKISVATSPKVEKPLTVELEESETAKHLKSMLLALNFSKPPDDIKASVLFSEIDKRVCSLSQPLLPAERVGDILFSGVLTEKQWFFLETLYAEFFEEYRNRREMDITRVSVTISSFLWKDTVKKMSDKINAIFNKFKESISLDPDVDISDVLAATADLAISEKVSSVAVRRNTKGTVNRVTIGDVPDRGGRPNEQAPPPPEVPSWQPRNDSSARGRSSGRGRSTSSHADPRNNYSRPMETMAPVAGDNFAQFGNVPVGRQPASRGPPITTIPGAVYNMQVPMLEFGGHGQFVNFGQGVGAQHNFHGQGGRGGPNDGYGGQGPNAFRGQYVYRGQNAGFGSPGGQNVGFGGHGGSNAGQQGYQRGPRGRGRNSRSSYGAGRGNPNGFGGFGGQGI